MTFDILQGGTKASRGWALPALLTFLVTVLQPCAGNAQLFNDPRFKPNFSGNVTVTLVNTAQTPDASTKVFSSPTSLVTTAVSTYKSTSTQNALKTGIINALNAALNSAGGFGLYMSPPNGPSINLDPAPVTAGFSDPGTQQIGLMMTLKNNSMNIDVTTPGPAPTSTNPKFTIEFSAQVAVLMTLQAGKVSISEAAAQMYGVNLMGNNLTGDIVKALQNAGIIKLPNLNQSADIPTALLSQLNTAAAAGTAALGALGGSAALVPPTTAIAIQVTSDACPGSGLQSVASPCTCAPGANVNYPSGCDPYGTAMCLSAAQLAKVPKCTGQYLACGKLPSLTSRDRSGNWFNKIALNCMKIPVAGNSPGGKTNHPSSNLPVSNPQNKGH
jgi:hypothetical protein